MSNSNEKDINNQALSLLGLDVVQAAASNVSCKGVSDKLGNDWGWYATVYIGASRDRPVLNIGRMSGAQGSQRVVVNDKLLEMPAGLDALTVVRRIVAECCTELYPNITIAVFSDGIGSVVYQCLQEEIKRLRNMGLNINLDRINWGASPLTPADKSRFKTLREKAHVFGSEAILSGRMSIDADPKTIDQLSELSIGMDESGRWMMIREELSGTPSNHSKTYMSTQIMNYAPHKVMHSGDESDALAASYEG